MGQPHRLRAILTAFLVTLLWSSSWVLIKIGLKDIPAIPFAGLRYTLAFICLLPFALRRGAREQFRQITRADWLRLAALGIICYTVTQGLQFIGLFYMPATTTSLMLSFTSVIVAGLGIVFLKERPGWMQWAGTFVYLCGALIYILPVQWSNTPLIGFIVVGLCVLANALSSILGRAVNRAKNLDPLTVTVVSMGVGGSVLLVLGLLTQGLPALTLTHWLLILWLAVVNSALAFTLWNRALQTLTAMESSNINNTMLFQIAIIAWLFLGEPLTPRLVFGLLLAGIGTFLVQRRSNTAKS